MPDRDNRQDNQIIVLENNYLHMTKQIDALETTVKKGFSELKEEFKCMREESDKKYASKMTEQVVFGLVALILISFVGALTYIVFNV